MVERLYQELENGMTDDEKSDLRKNLIDLDKQRKFLQGQISKRKLSKKDKQKVQTFRVRNYTKKCSTRFKI